jgi:hypothetical protein
MISEDCRFEGFDTRAWLNLLSLFTARSASRASEAPGIPQKRGTAVIVRDQAGAACAAFVTGRGPLDASEVADLSQLEALCQRLGVEGAVVIEDGAIEEITERAAQRLALDGGYAAQWLTLLGAARELEDEGRLRFWPARSRLPLPTTGMLERALDLLLPDDHVLLVALWEGAELWTACAISRSGGEIDRIVGPDLLLEWSGPLGGDYRRDQRVIQAAVARAMGPVHLGLFAQRQRVQELLRDSSPGAWARAVALREVIISPAPSYANVALAADAARAAGHRAASWLGGLDLYGLVAPAAEFAREHVARVGSATSILGFNPLQALATRLRRSRPPRAPDA